MSEFKKLNPAVYDQHIGEIVWMFQFLYRMDIAALLARDEIQQLLNQDDTAQAGDYLLDKMVSFYTTCNKHYEGKEYTTAVNRFEGILTWFLEHESELLAYDKAFEKRKVPLQILRYIFELGEEELPGDNEDYYNAENDADGDLAREIATIIQKRIIRNTAKEKVFERLQAEQDCLPNLGRVDCLEVLDNILAKTQEVEHFRPLFQSMGITQIRDVLGGGY